MTSRSVNPIGLLKQLPGQIIPWSTDIEERVNGILGYVTAERQIRHARDFAHGPEGLSFAEAGRDDGSRHDFFAVSNNIILIR